MVPWVYEFRWEVWHIAFLMLFLSIAVTVGLTILKALRRTAHDFATKQQDRIVWKATFEDLPKTIRTCRHVLAGELRERVCPNGFDCRVCELHGQLAKRAVPIQSEEDGLISGLRIRKDRLYHRGHTWVRGEADGTFIVGLDELGKRLVGIPDEVVLPPVGVRLEVNGTGWMMKRGDAVARILSPVEGEVIAVGGEGDDWFLRVKPSESGNDLRHLLNPREARFWLLRELERLQGSLSGVSGSVTLADGGTLLDDIPASIGKKCPAVWEEMFLQP